jgi:hypothetical protein
LPTLFPEIDMPHDHAKGGGAGPNPEILSVLFPLFVLSGCAALPSDLLQGSDETITALCHVLDENGRRPHP